VYSSICCGACTLVHAQNAEACPVACLLACVFRPPAALLLPAVPACLQLRVAEQEGIVFIDEIDKIVNPSGAIRHGEWHLHNVVCCW
jgi:hypothetical protein